MIYVVASLVSATIGVFGAWAPSSSQDPCFGNLKGCGATVVTQTENDFKGTIIVPGSEAANREVARNGGCDGCDWTLVVDCDRNEVDSPTYVECAAARCPDGTTYRIYLQRPTDANPAYVDSVCLTPTRRIVTVDDLNADMARYLTELTPPATRIEVQPRSRAVTKLATYFAAAGADTDAQTLDVVTAAGPATLTIDVQVGRYAWDFGDGAACETTDAGGGYDGGEPAERCDDRVAHVYAAARDATVTLRTTWHGTYTFDVGYGPVGPLPIPGNGVETPPVTHAVQVRDATAQLVGG